MELVTNSSIKRGLTWAGLWAASCLFCAAANLDSAPPVTTPPATNHTLTIPLEYREVSFTPMSVSLAANMQTGAFKKEPQLGKSKPNIRRGRLNPPNGDTNLIPFLWDCAQGKLYLDLNRNEDLTDDPAGKFSTRDVPSPRRGDFQYASFTNVPLTLKIETGRIPWRVDLNFSEYGSRVSVYAHVRSYWAGKALLAGREWQVGWIPGTERRFGTAKNDFFLLRDWSEREASFTTSDGPLDAFAFPQKVFLETAMYEVACEHARDGDQLKHQMVFRKRPAELGRVNVSGQFIKRLVLTDGPCVAIFDTPQSTLRAPAGKYGRHHVQLGKGAALAYLNESPKPALVVATNQPVTLVAGGPLTNSAAFSRQGNHLEINYHLLGAGGGLYAQAARSYENPPRFTVYQGDRNIGSGNFEFG